MTISPGVKIDFSFIFSLIAAIGVIYSIYKSSKSTSKEDITGILKANIKLDALCNSTDEIRMDVKGLNAKIESLAKTQTKHDAIIEELRKDIEENKNRISILEKGIGK